MLRNELKWIQHVELLKVYAMIAKLGSVPTPRGVRAGRTKEPQDGYTNG